MLGKLVTLSRIKISRHILSKRAPPPSKSMIVQQPARYLPRILPASCDADKAKKGCRPRGGCGLVWRHSRCAQPSYFARPFEHPPHPFRAPPHDPPQRPKSAFVQFVRTEDFCCARRSYQDSVLFGRITVAFQNPHDPMCLASALPVRSPTCTCVVLDCDWDPNVISCERHC